MLNRFRHELLRLINSERKKRRHPPLSMHPKLNYVAKLHSEDQALVDRNCSHVGSDGSRMSERVKRGGYKYKTCGENVARGYKNPKQVHQALMDSPGHAENVTDKDFVDVGLYVCLSLSGNHFWTEVFASPKDH